MCWPPTCRNGNFRRRPAQADGPGARAAWSLSCGPRPEPDSDQAETRRLGLLKAYRSRHLSLDRSRPGTPALPFALSNYGTAFLDTALYLRAHHRSREALGLYQEAVQWTSRANLAEVWTHYGVALSTGGDGLKPDMPGAITCFKNALAVKPIFEAWANLAGAYNQQGQHSHLVVGLSAGRNRGPAGLGPGTGQPPGLEHLGGERLLPGAQGRSRADTPPSRPDFAAGSADSQQPTRSGRDLIQHCMEHPWL